MAHKRSWAQGRVLITGGLGFVGSNLARRLVALGARPTLVDNMLPRHGGNLFNIEDIKDRVTVNFADVRDDITMNHLVQGHDVIFHLAGQVNHVDSIRNPLQDLDINCRGTLVILEACRRFNPQSTIVFTGTRGQYGPTVRLPVSEDHPMNPKGIYAITNMACEKMCLVYTEVHGIRTVCLRITNTFGPRHQMHHDEYGVVNWFIRKAIDDEAISVFGDGRIKRDFLYVDDVVEALLASAEHERAIGTVFNVGSGQATDFITLARRITDIAGTGRCRFTAFTEERKALEPGDYVADCSKLEAAVGWRPQVSLDEGLRRTIDFYRAHHDHYWTTPTTRPTAPRKRRLRQALLR